MILILLGTALIVWGGAWFTAGNWAKIDLSAYQDALKETFSDTDFSQVTAPNGGNWMTCSGMIIAAVGAVLSIVGLILHMTRKKSANEPLPAARKTNTVNLAICALMIGMSFALSFWSPVELPQGGSVTFASMVPVIFAGLLLGPKWGFAAAFVNSVMQLLMAVPKLGGYGLATPLAMVACILLDYILAYTVLGAASLFRGSDTFRAVFGTATACILRYICHVLSGWLLFGQWAEAGYSPLGWALFYNMTYMLPETVITVAVCALLSRAMPALRKQL